MRKKREKRPQPLLSAIHYPHLRQNDDHDKEITMEKEETI
jgi:hypothetical protein